MTIKTIIFDLGNTLIRQQIDDELPLDKIDLEPVKGASSILKDLHSSYRIGVLTNTQQSNKDQVYNALIKLGFSPFIDCIVTSIDVGQEKPSKIIFEHILKCLDTLPLEAVMVGNDLTADIMGARQMGIISVFYSCESEDWKQLEMADLKPDYIIQELSSLIPLLDMIDN